MLSNATTIPTTTSTTLILNPHVVHFYTANAFSSEPYNSSEYDPHIDAALPVPTSDIFFVIYGALCVANSFFTLFRAFFFAYSGILAGKYIHKRLVENLSKVWI